MPSSRNAGRAALRKKVYTTTAANANNRYNTASIRQHTPWTSLLEGFQVCHNLRDAKPTDAARPDPFQLTPTVCVRPAITISTSYEADVMAL